MSVLRYSASADTTITNAFKTNLSTRGTKANMGESDVSEIFSIYAHTASLSGVGSMEKSRMLAKFPIDKISEDRTAGNIPASGSVKFYMKFFNARHISTTPKKATYTLKPVTRVWDEGFGLDMNEYSDEGAASWLSASSGSSAGFTKWTAAGGDYSANYNRETYLEYGTEDLEFDVSTHVEEWIKTNTAATATLTFVVGDRPEAGDTVTIIDAAGTSKAYICAAAQDLTTDPPKWHGSNTSTTQVDSLQACIESANGHNGTITVSQNGAGLVMTLTQATAGIVGNTAITVSGATSGQLSATDFTGATGLNNYGIGVMLSSSLEDGSGNRSYYTKKFHARGTEFFFKRPTIEARWDSSTLDDRGRFYASSSLATGANNLNTLYLYITVNGQRQNVPTPAGAANTTAIYVRLYDAKTDGTIITPVGSSSFTSYNNVVTGGWVDTGVYSASFALDTAKTTVYDRWYSVDSSGTPGTCYHTGSFAVSTLKASSNNTKTSYVTSVKNLKDSYHSDETARFRLHTRNKNWSPTIYTVSKNTAENLIIPEMYYRIVRVTDNLEVIKYGTGSLKETRFSYDESGSYFDLNMSLLQTGYAYKMDFVYKLNNIYYKLPDSFKFRVE